MNRPVSRRVAWRSPASFTPAALVRKSSIFFPLKHTGVFCKVHHLNINASDGNSQSHSSFGDHLAVGQVVDVPEGEAGDGLLVGSVGLPNLQTQILTKTTRSMVRSHDLSDICPRRLRCCLYLDITEKHNASPTCNGSENGSSAPLKTPPLQF